MAKAKTLDQAIDKLVENYSEAMEKAARYATKKAEEDIYNYSMSFLQEYYDEYDPTSYDRSDSLKRAFIKFSSTKKKGKSIACEAGVEYNSWVLEEYVGANNNYAYDASKKYGQVDGDFVINNYLEGLHPYTNGSSEPGTKMYYHRGDVPTVKMKGKLLNYTNKFQKNLLVSFANQVVEIMRR